MKLKKTLIICWRVSNTEWHHPLAVVAKCDPCGAAHLPRPTD
jgi:hypothetical protein